MGWDTSLGPFPQELLFPTKFSCGKIYMRFNSSTMRDMPRDVKDLKKNGAGLIKKKGSVKIGQKSKNMTSFDNFSRPGSSREKICGALRSQLWCLSQGGRKKNPKRPSRKGLVGEVVSVMKTTIPLPASLFRIASSSFSSTSCFQTYPLSACKMCVI